MIDQKKTRTLYLWLLECKDEQMPLITRIFTFYAESRQEAEQIVDGELTLQPRLTFVALHDRPDGFVFFRYTRPGQIEIEE